MKELTLYLGDDLLGKVRVESVHGREVFSFIYDERRLKSGNVPLIDPDVITSAGTQFPVGKEIFGFLSDIAPDRWGRKLIRRKETQQAKREKRLERRLLSSDFIIGAYDLTRTGAIRVMVDGKFVSTDSARPAPPWTALRTLEECARRIDADEDGGEPLWIDVLLAPGSSLGGARPKANVTDEKSSLWIAKFPSAKDEWDVGAWERLVSLLAQKAGICVPETRLEQFSRAGNTFFSRRFDRKGDARIHFASAMTMAGAVDGEEGHSYLDIAEFLVREGGNPDDDLAELWSRVVFSRLVGNSDDHLRNHGYLLSKGGWRLAPMFDVNPDPDTIFPALNLTSESAGTSRDELISNAEYFRMDFHSAELRYSEIVSAVSNWRSLAKKMNFRRPEIERMVSCFCREEYL
ncbi:MAG: type II toxin-antitoxin system HipA family toxin [Kiritimatiellae bacterium]|nr:type II toxin-antitoxin system HipA family toxin [Kiritimatiellia bacterium]